MVIPAAVLLVAIGAIIGGIYDLRALHIQRLQLKAAANAAVLEGARALDYPDNNLDRLRFAARANVASRLGQSDIDTHAELDRKTQTLAIALTAPAKVRFPGPLSLVRTVSVASSAELVASGGPACLLALPDAETGASGKITIAPKAIVSADGCVFHSDRTGGRAFSLASTATVEVDGLLRAAGDTAAPKAPAEAPDGPDRAPRLVAERGDPLASRPLPEFDGETCDFENHVVTGHETLSEGVYCGGLTVDGGRADLYAGTYILKDGPLRVTNGGRLRGEFAGFYLAGDSAQIVLDESSEISLIAPRTGAMAGLLFRSGPAGDDAASGKMRTHRLASKDARRLTGTIYLPGDRLEIATAMPAAQQSDYTLIVAGEIAIAEGTRLALRTGYAGSPVPVPAGLGPTGQAIATLISAPGS